MSEFMVSLRGWHLALARAELQALLPNMIITDTQASRWFVVQGSMNQVELLDALKPAANVECILSHAQILPWHGSYDQLLEALQPSIIGKTSVQVATYTWKHGKKIEGCSISTLSKMVGAFLVEQDCVINLENSQHTFGICSDATSSTVAMGWVVGSTPAAFGSERRQATERPFFKPVSLDPRLARTAMNIACGPVSDHYVLDPTTGTGGIVIEASLSGRKGIGLDHNSAMVEGATKNLRWVHQDNDSSTCEILRGDATDLTTYLPPKYHGQVGGIVLDPPYGRNSQGSFQPLELLEKTLESACKVLAPSAGMVLILPIHPFPMFMESNFPRDEIVPLHGSFSEIETMLSSKGWTIENLFCERVHKSLSRLVVHAKFVLPN